MTRDHRTAVGIVASAGLRDPAGPVTGVPPTCPRCSAWPAARSARSGSASQRVSRGAFPWLDGPRVPRPRTTPRWRTAAPCCGATSWTAAGGTAATGCAWPSCHGSGRTYHRRRCQGGPTTADAARADLPPPTLPGGQRRDGELLLPAAGQRPGPPRVAQPRPVAPGPRVTDRRTYHRRRCQGGPTTADAASGPSARSPPSSLRPSFPPQPRPAPPHPAGQPRAGQPRPTARRPTDDGGGCGCLRRDGCHQPDAGVPERPGRRRRSRRGVRGRGGSGGTRGDLRRVPASDDGAPVAVPLDRCRRGPVGVDCPGRCRGLRTRCPLLGGAPDDAPDPSPAFTVYEEATGQDIAGPLCALLAAA